jgi:hypothetical protein
LDRKRRMQENWRRRGFVERVEKERKNEGKNSEIRCHLV